MEGLDELLFVTIKFGGYWTQVKNQGRKKYEGGKQRTCKFARREMTFNVLKDKIEEICTWLRGSDFHFFYHICGTSPKEYAFLSNDVEVNEMLSLCIASDRAEIVVVTCDDREVSVALEGPQRRDCTDMVDCSSTYDIEVVSSNDLVIGARFRDCQSFKQVLRTNAITHNFGVKMKASNRTRIVAICSHQGCPWRVRAALCADGQTFEVRKLDAIHSCPGVNRAGNKLATTSWIANEIEDIVRKNPEITPKQINNNLETTYGLSQPYMKLWRSKEQARERIFGTVDANYSFVPSLREELIRGNPGSHITYTCTPHDSAFKRFYVSFKVSVDGFLAGCRHLVGVDACHLKSKYLGVLLAANSLDGNNGLFTVAFAVAESESKSSWKWFLEQLAESFGHEIEHLAFISDMEKGLAEALKLVFPNAEHRVCLRHLWKNLKKNFCKKDSHKVGSLVWTAANACTEQEFGSKMNELYLVYPQLHAYLVGLPYKWSKCKFITEIRNHYNTNNMSESFNSWIGDARSKPAVDLIDTIRAMLMEQRAERNCNSNRWRGQLVPYVEDYLRELTTNKELFILRQSTQHGGEVEGRNERHVVNIDRRECTCGFWQLSGLPCIHAAAFIGAKDHPAWHLHVDECYSIVRYKMAYEGPISPLPGKEQWTTVANGVLVGVPHSLRPRGRPKKRRLKNFLEGNSTSGKSVHKCGRCGYWGHHRTTCKNPLPQSAAQQSEVHNIASLESAAPGDMFRVKLPVRREFNSFGSCSFGYDLDVNE